mmetsp:Transcript_30047/g.82488  ORF Transcript_30047/g.82488 Transcript_30047/m.82488 type:complete len:457 (-) Transcript_30047:898-2268(-)
MLHTSTSCKSAAFSCFKSAFSDSRPLVSARTLRRRSSRFSDFDSGKSHESPLPFWSKRHMGCRTVNQLQKDDALWITCFAATGVSLRGVSGKASMSHSAAASSLSDSSSVMIKKCSLSLFFLGTRPSSSAGALDLGLQAGVDAEAGVRADGASFVLLRLSAAGFWSPASSSTAGHADKTASMNASRVCPEATSSAERTQVLKAGQPLRVWAPLTVVEEPGCTPRGSTSTNSSTPLNTIVAVFPCTSLVDKSVRSRGASAVVCPLRLAHLVSWRSRCLKQNVGSSMLARVGAPVGIPTEFLPPPWLARRLPLDFREAFGVRGAQFSTSRAPLLRRDTSFAVGLAAFVGPAATPAQAFLGDLPDSRLCLCAFGVCPRETRAPPEALGDCPGDAPAPLEAAVLLKWRGDMLAAYFGDEDATLRRGPLWSDGAEASTPVPQAVNHFCWFRLSSPTSHPPV